MEKTLLVSPLLAQTIGLEDALLVQLLQDIQCLSGSAQVVFSQAQREQLLPFWNERQFELILGRLVALNLLTLSGAKPWYIQCQFDELLGSLAKSTPAPMTQQQPEQQNHSIVQTSAVPVFSMNTNVNEARQRNQMDEDLAYLKQPETSGRSIGRARKTKMINTWEPSESFPNLLSFHNIPLEFALSELERFRQYYCATDRLELSWDVRLVSWVKRAWDDSLQGRGQHDRTKTTNGESSNPTREKRKQVRDALRNIRDTDW